MFEAYDLKPHGLPAIPDDPPPHEGAMIDYPVVIEPPDLILVEVLEAFPAGRSRESGLSGRMARSAWVSMAKFTSRG